MGVVELDYRPAWRGADDLIGPYLYNSCDSGPLIQAELYYGTYSTGESDRWTDLGQSSRPVFCSYCDSEFAKDERKCCNCGAPRLRPEDC